MHYIESFHFAHFQKYQPLGIDHLLVEYAKNQHACDIQDDKISDERYKVLNDIIYCKDIIYFVPEDKLKHKILIAVQNNQLAGHLGYLKT